MLCVNVLLAPHWVSAVRRRRTQTSISAELLSRSAPKYPAPDIPKHPLNYIVGLNLYPVLRRKVAIGLVFFNSSLYLLHSLR